MAKLHTTESAAAYLQVSAGRVRQLIIEKRIKSKKYGRDHLIPENELKQYAVSGKKKAGRPPK